MKQKLLFAIITILFSYCAFAQVEVYTPIDLSQCGNEVFNLEVETPLALGNQNPNTYHVTYHLTESAAIEGFPFITNTTSFVAQQQQTIFVRVTNTETSEYAYSDFQVRWSSPPVLMPMPDVFACDFYTLPAPIGNDVMYYTAPNGAVPAIAPGTFFTVPGDYTIYERVDNGICSTESSFDIHIIPSPHLPAFANVTTCGSYTLPPLQVGHYYADSNYTMELFPGMVITASQTIYVKAASGVAPMICTDEASFQVNIEASSAFYLEITNSLICGDNPGVVTITAIGTGQNLVYQWSADAAFIPGATSNTISVTTPGNYTCAVTDACGNIYTQSVVISTVFTYDAIEIPAVYICNTGASFYTVDFSATTTKILNHNTPANTTDDLPANTTVTYFDSFEDANANTASGMLGNSYNLLTTQSGKTIYARIQVGNAECFVVRSFTLNIILQPVIAAVPANLTLCARNSMDTPPMAMFNLTNTINSILGAQDPAHYAITFHATQTAAENGAALTTVNGNTVISPTRELFIRMSNISDPSCYVITSMQLTVLPLPAVDVFPDVVVCGSFTLPPLTIAGSGYYSAANGAGPLAVGTPITSTQNVYVYNTNGTCSNQDTFKVTIANVASIAPPNATYCSSYTLPELPYGAFYKFAGEPYNPDNVIFSAGNVFTSTTTLYVYLEDSSVTPTCIQEQAFTITIVPFAPLENISTELVSCMNNGTAVFDLAALATQIYADVPTQYEVLFYENEADANAFARMISSP
ncbi:hypothetical protein [Flavobacterium sp. 3HN19-14]|uniref:hypothetical protein n=1 Tax=Flavobacterium sp. 3HN19-14 TaxID=3448133 RepID=UPI003EE117E7